MFFLIYEQKDFTESMRMVLIDWLVQVHGCHHLNDHTLHLGVGILDRYLSTKSTPLAELQLVAMTSLLLASKYEDDIHMMPAECCAMMDYKYTMAEILAIEWEMLVTLQFQVDTPMDTHF